MRASSSASKGPGAFSIRILSLLMRGLLGKAPNLPMAIGLLTCVLIILLVIILSGIENRCGLQLCHDIETISLQLLHEFFGRGPLCRRQIKDCRAVLRASVRSLMV